MALRDAGEKLREAALKTSARENGLSMSSKTGETGDGRAIESSQSTEGLQPMESQYFATLAPGTGMHFQLQSVHRPCSRFLKVQWLEETVDCLAVTQ